MIYILFLVLTLYEQKNRYPIPRGDIHLLYKRITCEFQSRLARFRQLGFTLDGIYLHIPPTILRIGSIGILV